MLEEPIEFFLKNHNLEEIKKKKSKEVGVVQRR